ncbi:mitochondrial K+-H+ exchange-related-domain-containing protein [Aspergillus cavernicola]|uniref:Mitochondrial K+-H+ exchange-related-domain-containing protein n=1 Tax=Aspergillus cavernicola TaxID=176166 RepID=A0ABR4IAX8_9EURO
MRLFVVPISTRRALIYARLLRKDVSKERSILDRATNKAAETWSKWEEADKGWKKHLVSWGNRVQQRIPYEEWGLKSIPSLSSQRRIDELHGTKKVDVLFPGNAIKKEKLLSMLHKLSTDRQDLHRQRMWWSFIAAPFTAPIALIPVIPNIPFFYLAYRGWSHWRALNGSKHLQFLIEKDLLNPVSHPGLVELYAKRVSSTLEEADADDPASEMVEDVEKSDDRILLRMNDAKKLATILDSPGLALEAERAIFQVSEQLKSPEPPAQEESSTKTSDKKQK